MRSLLSFALAPSFRAAPDRPIRGIVLWIVGPALPVELALQAADLCLAGCQLSTELDEQGITLVHDGDRRGSEVQSDDALPEMVAGFLVGVSLADQLCMESVSTADLAPDDANELDARFEAVPDHRVILVNDGPQLKTQPDDTILAPANAERVGLAFYAIHLVASLEPGPTATAKGVLLDSLECASSEFLDRVDVQVLA